MDITTLAINFADEIFADSDAFALGYSREDLDKLVESKALLSARKDQSQASAAVAARAIELVYCFRSAATPSSMPDMQDTQPAYFDESAQAFAPGWDK